MTSLEIQISKNHDILVPVFLLLSLPLLPPAVSCTAKTGLSLQKYTRKKGYHCQKLPKKSVSKLGFMCFSALLTGTVTLVGQRCVTLTTVPLAERFTVAIM
jgi:hypothetical protein